MHRQRLVFLLSLIAFMPHLGGHLSSPNEQGESVVVESR